MNYCSLPRQRLRKNIQSLKQREQGFMLIETLVAVIILAIGLLGMASMQVAGLKSNNSSYTRTQATYLAYDIIDKIRNNPSGDYAMALGSTPADVGGVSASTLCNFSNITSTLNCDEDTLAVYDQAIWVGDIVNALPSGQGGITVNGDTFTIVISWLDKEGNSDAEQRVSFQMSVVI